MKKSVLLRAQLNPNSRERSMLKRQKDVSRQGGSVEMYNPYDFGNRWSVPMTVAEYRQWCREEEERKRKKYHALFSESESNR